MTGNVKALSDSELKYLLERYEFELLGDYVLVKANKRKTLHEKAEGFSLLMPLQEHRRMKITAKAIEFWEKNEMRFSLLEVQNAINTLAIALQSPTEEAIHSQIKRTRSRLDNIYREGETNG